MFQYDTVSEAVNDLFKRGYTSDFSIHENGECLICNDINESLSANDFSIDETYRFEGATDPEDEMIVFAISSQRLGVKGIVVNAYGVYADTAAAKIVQYLSSHL
jgi:hypothetical protein